MRIDVRNSIEGVGDLWDSLAPRDCVALESGHLRAIERSGINQIEPFYLQAYEESDLVGIAYCFLMEMDFGFLEKSLPADAVRTLRAWNPRFLKTRMLECGLLSGLGETIVAREGRRAEVCHAAAHELERIARDARADLVLIRDVPHARRRDYVGAVELGYAPLLGFPIARMSLRWTSFEGYLDALKATSRYRVRHLLSQGGPDLETELIPRFGGQARQLAELWAQTHERAKDYSHEELTESYFVEIDRHLPERSHVVALKRHGEIVAFSLCLVGDDEYFSAHAGFDYAEGGDGNLHFLLSVAVLGDAIRRQAHSINRGITTYDPKFALGFEAEPQVYLVKHVANPRLTPVVLERLQAAIPQPENTHRPFRGQDLSQRTDLKALALGLEKRVDESDAFAKMRNVAVYKRANKARLADLYGFFLPFESAQGPIIWRDGRPIVMLGSNAYLGLATHPRVVAAAREATEKYGTGCSGSPFLNGTLDIHIDLARALAEFMRKEDALLFATGYQTNVGVVSALAGENDVLVMDRLDHASLVDGGRLSRAKEVRFRHNDMESLEQALRTHADRPKLVIVDSVFSMEGTIADLPRVVELARKYNARTMVDEAHAIGVLGEGGRGAAELRGVLDQVDVVMGTFSKSFASVGGFVAGDAEVIDYLRHAARSHMFSASLPPASVATVRAALEVIKKEPERRARLLANAEYMARRLQELGYDAPYRGTGIVPVHCGEDLLAFGAYQRLLEDGVFVNPVPQPAVPRGRELLRTSYMATHDQEMLERAAQAFARLRTASFPRRAPASASTAHRGPSLNVRQMVFLPVADRRSFARYYVAGSPHGLLRVPGFTALDLGQTVDCGISFGRERVIVQLQGTVVSKCLLKRPGWPLGIEIALLPSEARTRELMERFLGGESVPPLGRHAWRYHAEVAVEYGSDEAAEPEVVTDISLEGASIRTELDVDVGERVPLRLTAPLCDPIEVAGEVRWRRNGGDPALGMHFSFPGSVERRRMRELIAGIRDAIAGSTEMPVTLQ